MDCGPWPNASMKNWTLWTLCYVLDFFLPNLGEGWGGGGGGVSPDRINNIRSWISSKLKINDDKAEFLVISSSRLSFHFDKQLTIGNTTISQSSS